MALAGRGSEKYQQSVTENGNNRIFDYAQQDPNQPKCPADAGSWQHRLGGGAPGSPLPF